jgi:HlyD family secretion protein
VIQTANPDLMLRPGMTANVTIRIERREDVMRIPNAALRFRPPMPPGGRGPGAGAARGAVASRGAGGRGEAGAATRNEGGGRMAAGQPGQQAGARDGAPAGAANGADPGGPRGRRGGAMAGADSASGARDGAGGGWRGRHGGGGAGDGGAGMGAMDASAGVPAAVYVLRAGKPEKVMVMTGITDGSFTELRGGGIQPGDQLIVGADASASSRGTNLQPPPGMGGFRGPGGGGGRGR